MILVTLKVANFPYLLVQTRLYLGIVLPEHTRTSDIQLWGNVLELLEIFLIKGALIAAAYS